MFLIAGVFFTVFVLAYTKLGLNYSEDGQPQTPDTPRRQKELAAACRWWPGIYKGSLALVALSVVSALVKHPVADPFCTFAGAVSCLSGLWFVLVHPTAVRLFGRTSAA